MGASLLAMALATPAFAQSSAQPDTAPQDSQSDQGTDSYSSDIVVTAQRQSQRLQDVPIAVSAFSAESLEAQQIKNTSDLQLSLPNVTFSKTNFTSASFTIRGIGDLCVGVTCDSATAIHMNDAPLFSTRIFETEFFDLEQVEVLRGPQGTLYGRNATSGVVNFRTARPQMGEFHASGSADYGNYNSIKVVGSVNIPIGDTLAARFAGTYLNRDGYTRNVYDNSRLDGRDLYAIRGSLRWEPTDRTTLDLMGYYFRESDDRLRIQKQLCQRDPTGVLGCLAGGLEYGTTNANSTLSGVLTSRELLAVQTSGNPLLTNLALGSVYGPDAYSGVVNPANMRTVNTDSGATYFTDEIIAQARLEHQFDGGVNLSLAGTYQRVRVDSSQDYNLSVQNRAGLATGLATLQAIAAGTYGAGLQTYFRPIATALMPSGATGPVCTSLAEETGTGAYGGHKVCSNTPLDFDRSNQVQSSWTGEAIVSSDWDGMFNFLLGGSYANLHMTENSYYVNAFSLDYATGVLGSLSALGGGLAPGYLGTPTYRNNSDDFRLKSWGIFGETYFQFTDALKLTLGLRYNHDNKTVSARTTLANFLVPYTATNAYDTLYGAGFDADPATVCARSGTTIPGAIGSVAGCEAFQNREVTFSEWTGRAVLDYQLTPDNLLYVSYSRGYKSGGINPPLSPIFAVNESFAPEFVNAFEVGSKNQFGALTLNLTAFYYQYKALQLSRIVARTSVNDNVNANIWGVEAEAIIRPIRDFAVNLSFSYLNTEVSNDKYLTNPRDPGGGRSDAVIIKDITNASNCAVVPTVAGNAAGANGFVSAVNAAVGLRAPTGFGATSGIASTGAFGICSALTSAAAGAAGTAFGGIQVLGAGVPVNIRGNQLPQAPTVKFSAGMQYTAHMGDMTLVPRVDLTYTGESYGSIFNGNVNRIDGYAQANAQIQLNGADDRWFARAYVQNIFNNNAITGMYLADASSGLYTNAFTLEPRRYGIAVGFKF
jgi:outer membrane receptor protein involved in Fe transport